MLPHDELGREAGLIVAKDGDGARLVPVEKTPADGIEVGVAAVKVVGGGHEALREMS